MKFPKKAVDRFNAKINKTENCHIWNAARQKQGYGMFSYDGKSLPAHRFAYLLHKGEIAENMVVHQTCENNACVNPEHLVLQTKSQNKRNYNSVRVSKEMVESESVKYQNANDLEWHFRGRAKERLLSARFPVRVGWWG